MITASLIETLYEPASIQRWNDHIRPAQGFTELDKQAQKMVFAYVLGKFEEEAGTEIDWSKLIEAGLFEFLHRTKLTDIKPPIFHRLMEQKGDQINAWVLQQYQKEKYLEGGLFDRFSSYLQDHTQPIERRIINASHYLATKWEFDIVYKLNTGLYGLEKEREEIEGRLQEHSSLKGVQKALLAKSVRDLMDLVSQLRFQQRWGQTPRIPQTSVLGHSLVVAFLAYFCSLQMGACPKRAYNNFFCGLFHDLPEVLTRDIVAPVKRSVKGLDEIIKDIEDKEVEQTLYPLFPKVWHGEIRYFVQEEFTNRIIVNGKRKEIQEIAQDYNTDEYSPLDGQIIKACDELAAYTEAYLSIRHGIKSKHLREAITSIFSRYDQKCINGIDFGSIFQNFAPANLA